MNIARPKRISDMIEQIGIQQMNLLWIYDLQEHMASVKMRRVKRGICGIDLSSKAAINPR